jgi:Domain of unknown function (DUF4340)
MNFRGLIIAVVILAALGGLLYWSQHRKPPEASATVSANTAPVIIKVNPADVNQLEIKQKGSQPITVKKADGKWEITEPKTYRADQDAVTSMLSTLSGLNADRVVGDKSSGLESYGLKAPAVEVDITGEAHGVQQLLLGDDTPAGGDAYAALGSDPRVFTIASYQKTSLDKTLNDLRDKDLLTLNADKVSRVELLKKGQDIEFGRTKDGWQILKPSSSPADSSAVNDLVRSLTDARMELGGTGDAAAEFAHGTQVGTAKLTGDNGVQTLDIRKNKDDYYAKSSAVEGMYKVDSFVGQALDKKIDDFRQKKQATKTASAAK